MPLSDYFKVIRRHAGLVIVGLALGLAASGLLTFLAVPVYQAEARLFVGQQHVSTAQVAQIQSIADLSAKLLESYATIIRTHPIATLAIQKASLPHNARTLAESITVEPIPATQIIRLHYRSEDARLAQDTVNAIAQVFAEEIQKLDRATPQQNRDTPAVDVSVVEPALLPRTPVWPKPARNHFLGGVFGLAFGLGSVVLAERLDTTVKSDRHIEQTVGVSVLSSIPKAKTRRGEPHLERERNSVFAEGFRKLRTAIQLYSTESRQDVILVTSPNAHGGTSTIAMNLAAAFANGGSRTILVEADLRRPRLHQALGTVGNNGLALLLWGRISLDQALRRTSIDLLTFLPAGAIPPRPVEMLASTQMQITLDELRDRFETVVIDAPPLLPVADASAIALRVDCVLLVARIKQTQRQQLKESVQLIRRLGGNLAGVALNAVPMDKSIDNYSYHYAGKRTWRRRGLLARR